jgi:uncharacterized protein YrrD
MQVRFSTCVGEQVVDEGTQEILGALSGILIHPDTGKVEGFTVAVRHAFWTQHLFCPSGAIVHFGQRVGIADSEVLCDPGDVVRLESLFADPRTVLGQRIQTESGQSVGRCRDVQFDTETLHVQWLFPRKNFRWGAPIAVNEILEVKRHAIVIRDRLEPVKGEQDVPVEDTNVLEALEVPKPGVSRTPGLRSFVKLQ